MPNEKDPMDAEMEGFEAPPAAPPAAPPGPPRPGGGLRPRPGGRPAPPPPAKPSKLKGYLMLGILISTVVLTGAIAWKIYDRVFRHHKREVNVEAEAKAAIDQAVDAQKDIFKAESNVWIKGEAISAATAVMIQDKLEALQASDERIKDLLDLLHLKKAENSAEWELLANNSLLVKLWILDATDLLEKGLKDTDYGGLYIPMYRTMDTLSKTQKELKEIQVQRQAILDQNDPELRGKTRTRIKSLEDKFAAHRDKLNDLNDYIKKGLARDDLSPKLIKELDELRDEAAKAQMSFKQAGMLRQEFRE